MKVIDVKCPHCGGELRIGEDRRECFCEYCGSKLFIDDGIARQEVIIKDEAKLRELQMEEDSARKLEERLIEVRALQAEAKKRKPFDWICIISSGTLILLWIILAALNIGKTFQLATWIGLLGFALIIVALIRSVRRDRYDKQLAALERAKAKRELKKAKVID